jgi:hypothetical protein
MTDTPPPENPDADIPAWILSGDEPPAAPKEHITINRIKGLTDMRLDWDGNPALPKPEFIRNIINFMPIIHIIGLICLIASLGLIFVKYEQNDPEKFKRVQMSYTIFAALQVIIFLAMVLYTYSGNNNGPGLTIMWFMLVISMITGFYIVITKPKDDNYITGLANGNKNNVSIAQVSTILFSVATLYHVLTISSTRIQKIN